MIKKIIFAAVVLTIIAIVPFIHTGKDVEDLKEKYAYSDSKFIEVMGLNVHYRDTGEGEIPLVLLHGVSSSLHTWEAWQKELSTDFRVITLDIPSFGLTGPFSKGTEYSEETYMKFLDKFLSQLNIEKCYLGGNSFGGWLTWNYTAHAPEKVEKALILDAAGFKVNFIPNFGLIKYGLTAWSTHYLTPKFLINQSVHDFYGNDDKISKELVTRYHDLLLRKGSRQGFTQVLRMLPEKQEPTMIHTLKNIETPSLIMWGKEDTVFPYAEADSFVKYMPHSKKIVYDGVGHMPMEELPYESAKDVREFLLED